MAYLSWELFGILCGLVGQAMTISGLLVMQWVPPALRDSRRWFIAAGFGLSVIAGVISSIAFGSFNASIAIALCGFIISCTRVYSGSPNTKYGITQAEYGVWFAALLLIFIDVFGGAVFSLPSKITVIITALHIFFRSVWIGIPFALFVMVVPLIKREKSLAVRDGWMEKITRREMLLWPIFFGITMLTGLYALHERAGLMPLILAVGVFASVGFLRAFMLRISSVRNLIVGLANEASSGAVVFIALAYFISLPPSFESWDPWSVFLAGALIAGFSLYWGRHAWLHMQKL